MLPVFSLLLKLFVDQSNLPSLLLIIAGALLHFGESSLPELMKMTGLSRNTFYKYKKELKTIRAMPI